MKLEVHGPMVYLTNDEGVIHIPGTLYLNEDYSNPHTREVVGRSLRIWARFASAFDIDLAKRSMAGHWLTEKEKRHFTIWHSDPYTKSKRFLTALYDVLRQQATGLAPKKVLIL